MKRKLQSIDSDLLRSHCRFVAEAWRRFEQAPDPAEAVEAPGPETMAADPARAIRRFRQLQSVHLLWRDLSGEAGIAETGQGLSALARTCIELALSAAERQVAERHGWVEDEQGERARLIVFGLGKLGGDELNFNSDIDLVFAYDAEGRSSGPRRVDAADWMKRVARELIRLLDTVDENGRAWIVDARLRPFGESGALVWSVPAMEQYFLSEGRTWERYAWLKAAPVAGDLAAGRKLIEALQPFVFRRYLDYGIFESLRELHRRIDANARARSDREDIKRGRGGIRELEFLVQSLQILRGGREPRLRQTGFLPALEACADLGVMPAEEAEELRCAYGFLRILENRLQAMTARQGHELPTDPEDRQRLAELMDFDDWGELTEKLGEHRQTVTRHFSERFRDPDAGSSEPSPLWPPGDDIVQRLDEAGFQRPEEAAEHLERSHAELERRALSAEGRERLERLMPGLIEVVGRQRPPDTGLTDLLRLIDQVSRRSAYLALLRERPETLERLVRVFHVSQRVAEWIIASPQLLDDLLDPINGFELPAAPTPDPNDKEASLWALSRWRQAGFLRTALAELDDRLDAVDAGRQLSAMADTIVDRALALTGGGDSDIAVIGYGNLGASQLHFESDLDLVFLHRSGEAPHRIVQRLVSALQMPLPGGRLFEIDTRLRPNGRAGMLVSTLDSFDDYQRNKAWTWEHQALIRARWIAGDQALEDAFEAIRKQVLTQRRDDRSVAEDLAGMRERQRRERRESPVKRALTDLQFLAELGVLTQAADHPALVDHRDTGAQLEALAQARWIDDEQAQELAEAWRKLLQARHLDWLRREPASFDTENLRPVIDAAWTTHFDRSTNGKD
ncbi:MULTISPECIES: bifunctional [glutamate--ammonia ligase]-adenylyl-L-tyrosine phosphorylase/[glutamate--ammonia-ligase] adenylyltransferase [unclassified Wenzhouxiangella]|uniref:bifunctional [glutamate--ammonia ligase]-adenylyl-L-tyrosine phosphorylase/[glutamate--ammonia-ligase] adenylyltransferase n=1 Tax=unclassified Wenzhouxiangella TaxID=2613841 RepID=UPI000E3269A9|nr:MULTISPECIES: bifunctional [glutamate--ammonia ligase]-adenylyl-L-tyrosine phosphorylase/[glutamate--ammonia-ligase] adenylyltransferase [unclassified Wenzhouxiangella]RFF27187.1 bifunctional [glutamate--ammonia ligase]-adenylyl-L-tyrosine phosphorylase/[glutamate--ammonia-ligase] adenylyltransferase [Wenzhouxiangella sp. 15181]RFP69126.1 bifunctional [glutamate--ammonia ligase]-adenylyl-L-tyrosine phosphorylase/[glutamate--ammonia-ligase] adenylyltransferase [Wenzhouxiangella sp. 15190]